MTRNIIQALLLLWLWVVVLNMAYKKDPCSMESNATLSNTQYARDWYSMWVATCHTRSSDYTRVTIWINRLKNWFEWDNWRMYETYNGHKFLLWSAYYTIDWVYYSCIEPKSEYPTWGDCKESWLPYKNPILDRVLTKPL